MIFPTDQSVREAKNKLGELKRAYQLLITREDGCLGVCSSHSESALKLVVPVSVPLSPYGEGRISP